jgi:hypothetical protein
MSDPTGFKFSLFHGLIEVIANKDLPPQLVEAISAALVLGAGAILVGVAFWGLSRINTPKK